jgi:hypothetical protein
VRPGRRAVVALAVAAALLLGGAAPAVASWYATQSGPGTGGASAGSVLQAATPTVSLSNKNTVAVSWSSSTLSTGAAVSGYYVARYGSSGALATVQNGCAGALTSTSCTETNVPDGTWTYAVTARFNNWTGPQSAKSAAVVADTTPPVSHFSLTSITGGASLTGTTLYYAGASAGSFRIANALTDAGSGPGGSTDGSINTGGWSNSPQAVTSPTGGPYVTKPYNWTAGTTAQPVDGIVAYDAYGNSVSNNIVFTLDNDVPTGGAISYADGVSSSKTIPVTLASVSDAGSGVASRLLQQAQAPLSSAGCGSYGAYATVVTSPTATQNVTVTAGSCFTFRFIVTDAVGNQLTTTSPSVVQVPTYANTVLSTASLVSQWRLDDAAGSTTAVDTGPAKNNGTWTGSPTLGAAGAIAGDGDTAVQFDGVDDVGKVTRQISDDFSVELWMKSTNGAGTGTNWFNGAGLVDADVSGVAADFGLSLLANGKLAIGTGMPDTSALTTGSYVDGVWHHVVMTRVRSTGVMTLYVDGAQVAQATTGGTQSLTASATLSFGRVQTGSYYTGSLDEIAVYSAALTPAQVLAHYRAGSP